MVNMLSEGSNAGAFYSDTALDYDRVGRRVCQVGAHALRRVSTTLLPPLTSKESTPPPEPPNKRCARPWKGELGRPG